MKLKDFRLLVLLLFFTPAAAQVTLKGRVTSGQDNPLGGAEVYIKGPGLRFVTGPDGIFEFKVTSQNVYTGCFCI